jgi:hypothetical protein
LGLDKSGRSAKLHVASGTNLGASRGSANRAGSGHGGSGASPDVRDLRVPNQSAPEVDNRPDAQVGFLLSALMRDSEFNPIRIMTTLPSAPGIRIRPENPNHHLWNNHGTWFLHYTVHPTPFTKERIRRSLRTKGLSLARRSRDDFFAQLGSQVAA